jgi:hypothetical protein
MIQHCNSGAAGVLFDHGANAPIRFAVWFDAETGAYEALKVASNGVDIACDSDYKAIRYRGRAKGRLELVPFGDARLLGRVPVKTKEEIATPLPQGAKEQGLDDYKRLYFTVWNQRGESLKCIDDRWLAFLKENSFLDHLCLRKSRTISIT